MLRWTLERAGRIVPEEHVVTIVGAQHKNWWQDLLWDRAAGTIVIQPADRGTAPGVLLPLLRVYQRDRRAVVAVLPSDHFAEDEGVVSEALDRALTEVARKGDVLLLGMTPERTEGDYGWILPGELDSDGGHRVLSFIEKPGRARAQWLRRQGGVWSTFTLVARAEALLALFERSVPRLLALATEAVRDRGWSEESLELLYGQLPHADFSRDVLQNSAPSLRLSVIPPCGWTDLGTPARLARWAATRRIPGRAAAIPSHGKHHWTPNPAGISQNPALQGRVR